MKHRKALILTVLIIIGLSQFGHGLYIHAKASLANRLITDTWQTRNSTAPQKPWPWADTWAVARLSVPRLNINQFVMQDASGESLAFGPGASTEIKANGYNIIAGHRDTHFRHLDKLEIGDSIEIETFSGETIAYKITNTQVIDIRDGALSFDKNSNGLSLITCWPMNAITPGGPLRYVVSGEKVKL